MGLAALFGSTLAGTTGFGGAAVLLPVLVHFFGVRDAIPILTIAQLIGNGSRVWFYRSEVNWRIVAWFAAGAVPMALLGGYLFSRAPSPLLARFLGVFLLATLVWRWLGLRALKSMTERGFAAVGLVFGFLSALVGGVGPFVVPFFLGFGLVKGAFIGTEAMATVTMHVFKLIAYHQTSLISDKTLLVGFGLGPTMILGTWLGKQIVVRISSRAFVLIVEATLLIAGITFLARG
jgi:uncharacterized membrane protein YfcA